MIYLELYSKLLESLSARLCFNRLISDYLLDVVRYFPEQCVQIVIEILRRRWKFRMKFL